MDLFSISQLARYSGIKQHTIRIWEQRYNALKPNRSEGNTRYYDGSQLRRLLNIVSLMDAEYKVSELCGMSDTKLFSLINQAVDRTIDKTDKAEYYISQCIAAGMSYDEQHFEKIFSNCMVRYGMKEAYTKVLYPMLVRVGLMWSADSIPPANEHFISNLLRQKMFAAIDALPPAKPGSDKWLLFLKEGEFHEIGLLFASYLIRLSGRQVIYLGSDVPARSLEAAVKNTKPQHLLFFLVHNDLPEMVDEYLQQLEKSFSGKRIFAAGDEAIISQLKPVKKTRWLKSVEDLERELSAITV
jgi:DNA-binding transcriptional MerR regulator